MLEIKKRVQPPLVGIVAAIANAAEKLEVELRITSGIDGTHSEWSGHYQLRSVDVGTKEHMNSRVESIRVGIEEEMKLLFPPDRVYVQIHSKGDRGPSGNEHIHVQFK